MSPKSRPGLLEIVLKAAATHSLTYMVMGLAASTLLDYSGLFATTELGAIMRPMTDPWVMAGPLFQPLRGALFGLVVALLLGKGAKGAAHTFLGKDEDYYEKRN